MNKDLKTEFKKRFESNSDQELINAFNSQVENHGSGSAKMAFLSALREELNKRSIDFSSVSNAASMSYANCAVLKDKKMCLLDELTFEEVAKIADTWMKKEAPSMLYDNAKLTRIHQGQLTFVMDNGDLTTSFNNIIKKSF
jgi:hypothetical protein